MNISAKMRKPGALYTCLRGLISNKQIIRQVMRVSVVVTLIMLTTLQVLLATSTKGQDMRKEKVTVGLNHEGLVSGLKKIEQQTSLRFYYRRSDVQTLPNINLTTDTRTVEKTLEELLKNTGLTFSKI
jgi:lipopolysaccharide export LptBFGC system permease protein LptF